MFPLSRHLGGKSTHSVFGILIARVMPVSGCCAGGGEIERERGREDAHLELVQAPALSVM